MADNQAVIASFLRGKGLPPAAIAGILGNLQVESGFNPGASNPNEGAIGIAQWEGGRRTALDEFARQTGGSEQDLGTQLNYLWHELTTSYGGALQAMRSATDPGQAAAAWDEQFEGSDGSARGQRVANAQAIFGGVNNLGSGVPVPAQTATAAGGGGAAGGGAAAAGLSASDYKAALGTLSGLLTSVPELKGLLDNAIATDQPVNDFVNSVNNSAWYKTHSATARQQIALQVSDPATYQDNLNQMLDQIRTTASGLGVQFQRGQDTNLAIQALTEGWSGDVLTQKIAATPDYRGVSNAGPLKLTGQMAATAQQLQQLALSYGQDWQNNQYAFRAQQILDGSQTVESYKQQLQNQAMALYPALTQQIKAGMTVADLAAPYQQSMSQLLELNPNSIKITDPLVQKALQGSTSEGKAPTTLGDFQSQLRADPRWAKTQNATDTMSTALLHVGADFGFGPTA